MSQVKAAELDRCWQFKDLIVAAAAKHQWAPELIAGIISRETGGTWDPELIGDIDDKGHGHGHGLGQIDDRSFGDWLASHDWTDPAVNIGQIVAVLSEKYDYLDDHGAFDHLSDAQAERAAIAAYNCGEGNVAQAIRAGQALDSRTADHDYSADVLHRAAQFKEVFA